MKGRNEYLFHDPIILQKRKQATSAIRGRSVAVIEVRARPGNRLQGLLDIQGRTFACALGRGGIRALKREGDGATPLAALRPLGIYFRRDRRGAAIGPTLLGKIPIRPDLGWCDDPGDANYNRPVRLPFRAGHETMLREDRLYDICVVLDWNICPRRRGRGSAIFLHLARPGMAPTEGCIAVTPRTMARILPLLSPRTRIHILQ